MVFQEIPPPRRTGIRVGFRSLRSRTFHHPDKQEFVPVRALAEHWNVVTVRCGLLRHLALWWAVGETYSLWGYISMDSPIVLEQD